MTDKPRQVGRPRTKERLCLPPAAVALIRGYLFTRLQSAKLLLDKFNAASDGPEKAYAEPAAAYWSHVCSALEWLISTLPKPVDDPREPECLPLEIQESSRKWGHLIGLQPEGTSQTVDSRQPQP